MGKVVFDIQYGRNLIQELEREIAGKKALIVTQQILWEKFASKFSGSYITYFVETMEESALLGCMQKLPQFDVTIGLGGGMAVDCAKYFAWKAEKETYLIPTIISVDACFSYPIAVRINNNVTYIGEKIPNRIYVDYDIVKSAPIALNRFGLGDVLSCYTALYDWKTMCDVDKAIMNQDYYNKAQSILDELFENPEEIYNATEKGIQMIMSGYKWVGETSYSCGYCFFEEGSEHYFAYALESITGLHLAHGQLVCLGIYVMSKFQEEGRQHKIGRLLKQAGIDIKPESIGITYENIEKTLSILNEYVITQRLAYSKINERLVDRRFIREVIAEIRAID